MNSSTDTGTHRSVRAGVVVGLSVVGLLAGVAFMTSRGIPSAVQKPVAKSSPAGASASPRQNSCSVCLERNPLLPPSRFAGWENGDVQKAYEAAAKYPATMDLLHCFCECQESTREHHKTLLTCFTSPHAAGCGICQHEALMAAKLKDEGKSDEEVENLVETRHKLDGHRPTKGRGI